MTQAVNPSQDVVSHAKKAGFVLLAFLSGDVGSVDNSARAVVRFGQASVQGGKGQARHGDVARSNGLQKFRALSA